MTQMRAARLHAIGEPISIDTIDVPEPRPTDVLVRVKACGIVPNMANVISNWPTWFPHQPLAKLPAIFGLDAAGVVDKVGEAVIRTRPGDRVYVNPLRSCGSCYACRGGQLSRCRYFTLNGYFSTCRDGQRIFDPQIQDGPPRGDPKERGPSAGKRQGPSLSDRRASEGPSSST